MLETKDLIPIVVSVIALAVSGLALYFSQLRKALVGIVAGDHLNIYHFTKGNCAIVLSVTLVNKGARLATVQHLALLVQESDSKEGYLLEPAFYERIDEHGDFQHDSQPMPVPVLGLDVETRLILFRSSSKNPSEFRFTKPGTYRLTVLGWLRNSIEPQATDSFSVVLTEEDAATLAERRESKSTTSVRIGQSEWKQWAAHKVTSVEVSALKRS